MRKALLKIILAAGILAAGTLILEFAAGRLFPAPDNFYIWPPNLHRTFTPDQEIMPGTSPRVRFQTNSFGLRSYNPAPNDDYRILVLGGSAAECLYLDQRRTWPRLIIDHLERIRPRFRTWVGNGGRSGQTSRDHIFHFEYLPLRNLDIDAAVILIGANDLQLRLQRGEAYDPGYLGQPGARLAQIDRAFLSVPYPFIRPPLPFYKRTGLWRAARRAARRFIGERPQDDRGEVIALWREYRRRSPHRVDLLPDMEPALREYLDNLRTMVDLASRRGIRLIFVTQPAIWRADMPPEEEDLLWGGGVGNYKNQPGQPYYTPRALAEGLEVYNRILIAAARQWGIEYFDLAADFPRTTDYFYDDLHFTLKGSELVAEKIGNYLSSRPPYNRPPPR